MNHQNSFVYDDAGRGRLKSRYKDDFGGGFNFNCQRGPGFTPMEAGGGQTLFALSHHV